jgi:hypothetical protein
MSFVNYIIEQDMLMHNNAGVSRVARQLTQTATKQLYKNGTRPSGDNIVKLATRMATKFNKEVILAIHDEVTQQNTRNIN